MIGSTGNDTLIGGAGADIYQIGRNAGADLVDNRGHGADGDRVAFEPSIYADQLWFQKAGNDLKVSVIGINSSVTLSGWYLSDQNKVSEFTLADGNRLLAGQVENLVNAMASMTPPLAGQIHLTPEQNDLLSSVLAANWQAH